MPKRASSHQASRWVSTCGGSVLSKGSSEWMLPGSGAAPAATAQDNARPAAPARQPKWKIWLTAGPPAQPSHEEEKNDLSMDLHQTQLSAATKQAFSALAFFRGILTHSYR